MRTLIFNDADRTDPPSVTGLLVPETESDRCIIAELCDQPVAARAPEAKRAPAQNPRIAVSTLAAELGIKKNSDPVDPEFQQFLQATAQATGLTVDTLLRTAFFVRFYAW